MPSLRNLPAWIFIIIPLKKRISRLLEGNRVIKFDLFTLFPSSNRLILFFSGIIINIQAGRFLNDGIIKFYCGCWKYPETVAYLHLNWWFSITNSNSTCEKAILFY